MRGPLYSEIQTVQKDQEHENQHMPNFSGLQQKEGNIQVRHCQCWSFAENESRLYLAAEQLGATLTWGSGETLTIILHIQCQNKQVKTEVKHSTLKLYTQNNVKSHRHNQSSQLFAVNL